jgi:serine/threonine-protein kinase RsbW
MTAPRTDGESIPGLELEVPPKPVYVRAARHAVGALARLGDLPEDLIEDIKLAVSEACTTAVGSVEEAEAAGASPVRVSMWMEDERVAIEVVDPQGTVEREVSGDPADLDTGDLPFDRLLSLPIIRGLVDDLTITGAEDGGVLTRMVVSVQRDEP